MFNIAEIAVFRLIESTIARARRPSRRQGVTIAAPRRLKLREQWDKVSAVLVKSFTDANRASELQARAAQQLDLASYALYNLVDELSLVMHEPLGRVRASVHQLDQPHRTAAKAVLAA